MLQSAGVAVITGQVVVPAGMLEWLAGGRELQEFRPVALRQNGVAGVAVTGLNRALAVGRQVLAVVAAEAAGPVLVADVIGINLPTRLHLRKEIVPVQLLDDINDRADARLVGIAFSQMGRDALQRLSLGLEVAGQRVNRVGLDPRQRAVDVAQADGEVHGVVGCLILVGRPVVAIHAVHRADRETGRVVRKPLGPKLGDYALRVHDADPGDFLPRHIGGDVLDLVLDVHVPVDAAFRPVRRVGTADFHQETEREGRVGFVAEEVVVGAFEVADEFLRPMALLAGFLRRAQVFDRRGDRARVFVKGRGVKLVGAGNLGFDEPRRSGADVTLRAGNAGVRAVLVSDQFRLHHRVAGLAAELDRSGEMIGVVAAHGAEQQENQAPADEEAEHTAVARAREIDDHHRHQPAGAMQLAPFAQRADDHQHQPHHREPRRHDVRQNADVRVRERRHRVQQEQQEERKQAADDDDQPGQTEPVAQQRGLLAGGRGIVRAHG